MRSTKPIMLVEDDYVDAMTLKRALKELKVANHLVHKSNGEEALKYLEDRENPRPCIWILNALVNAFLVCLIPFGELTAVRSM